MQQSSSWVSLFEIARNLEVRNLKIDVHCGALIMAGTYRVKDGGIISPDWKGEIEGGLQQSSTGCVTILDRFTKIKFLRLIFEF